MSIELDPGLQALLPVAIISHAHPSISKGGAEIAAHTLFQGLRALGIPAVFIAAVPLPLRDQLDLGADEYAVFHDPAAYDHLYQLGDAATLQQLRGVLRETGARLLNFHHFMSFGINALRDLALTPDLRTVVTLHEFLAICHHHGQMVTRPHRSLCSMATESACGACFPELGWRRMGLRAELFRDSFAAVDHFIAPSQFLIDRFVQWGVPAARMGMIENGLARFIPEQDEGPAAGQKSTWVFGYFGQVTPFKGVDVLLTAAERLAGMPGMAERIEIRIHGNLMGVPDDFRARLQELTASLPFLRFTGPYENGAVFDLMRECDYVLTPSVWWENSPVVIQEAYAAGRPVICTGIGGMAEKVRNGVTGLHFRRGDGNDLARIIATATDPATHAALLAHIPQPFGPVEMARRYLQAFAAAARPGSADDGPTTTASPSSPMPDVALLRGQRKKRGT